MFRAVLTVSKMKRPVDSKETQNPRYPVRGTLISSCCESELEALEFAEMIAQNCIFISGWTIEEKTEALGWVPVQQ